MIEYEIDSGRSIFQRLNIMSFGLVQSTLRRQRTSATQWPISWAQRPLATAAVISGPSARYLWWLGPYRAVFVFMPRQNHSEILQNHGANSFSMILIESSMHPAWVCRVVVDWGNSNDPCPYGKWQAGSSLWDERAEDVRAFLGCQIYVLRSWSRSQLWWDWKVLVPPLGSQITLGGGHHGDKSTHPIGLTWRWGKTATSVLPKAAEDDWYLAECPFVATKKR